MNNYLVHTTLIFGNGTTVQIPVKLLSDKDGAQQFARERQRHLMAAIAANLVEMKGESQAEPLGLTLGQVLAELGIMRFATQIAEIPVEDQRISIATEMPNGIAFGGRA